MTYRSNIPYKTSGIQALAVYCSDGRFEAQCEDFVRKGLGIERFDLIVLPGGPARLVGPEDSAPGQQTAIEELSFLVKAHNLQRVVLIQHDDCGYYQHVLGISGDDLRPLQQADAAKAIEAVHQATGLEQVECYLAVADDDDGVSFEPISGA